MRCGVLTFSVVTLFLLLLAGCPKPAADKPAVPAPEPAANHSAAPAPVASADDTANAAANPRPLAESPFNLAGEQLGAAPASVLPGLSATGLQFDEYWRDESLTGMIISRPGEPTAAGLRQARAYFEAGELVCYSQVETADEGAFELRVADLTKQYGEPLPEQPLFVAESEFMQFFDEEQVSDLHCWADLETETACLAGLSRDGERAVYMIMQPARFDKSHASTMAASGS